MTTPDERPEVPAGPPPGVLAAAAARWVLVAVAALVAVGTIAHFAGLRPAGGRPAPAVKL